MVVLIICSIILSVIGGAIFIKYFTHTHEWELYKEFDLKTYDYSERRIVNIYRCKKCGEFKKETIWI